MIGDSDSDSDSLILIALLLLFYQLSWVKQLSFVINRTTCRSILVDSVNASLGDTSLTSVQRDEQLAANCEF